MPLANSSITFKAFFMFCHGLIQFHLVRIIWNQQLVLFYLNLNWNKWMCLEDLSFSSFASSFKAWSSILYFCMFLIKCYSFLILIGTFRLTKLNGETIVTFFYQLQYCTGISSICMKFRQWCPWRPQFFSGINT